MKVVTAKEMARLEQLAFERGADGDAFMQKVALGMADAIQHFIDEHKLKKKLTFVAGKGNNGGDAFCVALLLAKKGFEVEGYHLENWKNCSPLCQKYGVQYQQKGYPLKHIKDSCEIILPNKGILLDGLLGTGFEGESSPELQSLFQHLNKVQVPLFAVDIPSGLNGNTGEVVGSAIIATHTLFLGQPKTGFFIERGWDHVGRLIPINFGLDSKLVEKEGQENFHLIGETEALSLFPPIDRGRHKYEAGYVVGLTGSKGMMGASLLSGLAALKAGAGIVKVCHLEDEFKDVGACPELIHHTFGYTQVADFLKLTEKASALYVGPGLGLSEQTRHFLKDLIEQINKPCIFDADALTLIAQEYLPFPKETLLTPHIGEMHRLLGQKPRNNNHLLELCQQFVEKHGVVLLLKGGPSFIFQKGHKPLVNPTGDPGLATAGSGDVLTGMLAGLLSQKGMTVDKAAKLGVFLHGRLGEIGAQKKSSYGLTASDLIKYMYRVFPKQL